MAKTTKTCTVDAFCYKAIMTTDFKPCLPKVYVQGVHCSNWHFIDSKSHIAKPSCSYPSEFMSLSLKLSHLANCQFVLHVQASLS